MFVFNQSKSVPVNKDQFKSYYSCNFILKGTATLMIDMFYMEDLNKP